MDISQESTLSLLKEAGFIFDDYTQQVVETPEKPAKLELKNVDAVFSSVPEDDALIQVEILTKSGDTLTTVMFSHKTLYVLTRILKAYENSVPNDGGL